MPNNLEAALPDLLSHLRLDSSGNDLFRGFSQKSQNGRIFGGLVFAQAMCAAIATVEDRPPHSAHAYFLRAGDPNLPIDFEVDRIRDGRSFATRRVVALQNGKAIFNLALSCHQPEPGPSHQLDVEIPRERQGESHEDGIRRGLRGLGIEVTHDDFGFGAFEMCVEDGLDMGDAPKRAPEMRVWLRARGTVPSDDHGLHAALLAYASDFTIMIPTFHAHPFGAMSRGTQSASLDHAMWFHAPFRADEWIYVVQDSPILSGSRGLGRALFYTEDGRLVASAVQEGLVRHSPPA